MQLQKHVDILKYQDKVVLANRYNGTWIRVSDEVFGLIQDFLKADVVSPDEVLEFSDIKDKEYFDKVISEMKKCYMVKDGKTYFEQKMMKSVIIETTNRCNLHCSHCCVAAGDDLSGELDTESMKKILDKCMEWNPEFIAFSGGEPLFRRDFFELLFYLRKKYQGKIGLCTNGLLITDQNVETICQNVDQIDISIDGVDEETCSVYRGKGFFEKVIRSIELLQGKGFENISLSMVFSDINEHLEGAFAELNKKLGTKPIYRMLAEKGRAKENKEKLASNEYEESYVPESFIDEDGKCNELNASKCVAGKHSIMIRHNGDVYPCPSFTEHEEFCMGNILEVDSIQTLIDNKNVKTALFRANRANGENCKNCPVNIFCFSCPGDPYRFSSEEKFQEYCKVSKKLLMERVWGV